MANLRKQAVESGAKLSSMAKRTAELRAGPSSMTTSQQPESGAVKPFITTIVIIIGTAPYKETLLLPRVTRIAVATVKQAITEQQAKPLPSHLPRGCFMVVEHNAADLQVAMFKYD